MISRDAVLSAMPAGLTTRCLIFKDVSVCTPKAEASKWLLEWSFPKRWGPQAKGAAHKGKAPDRLPPVIFYKLDSIETGRG